MQICFNTTREVADALQALADMEGISRSAYIARIIGEQLNMEARVQAGGDRTKCEERE